MCGRYALGIRAFAVRQRLQEQNLPVRDAPADDEVRETYNFAPGSFGLVYRADIPDNGLNDEAVQALQESQDQAQDDFVDQPASEILEEQQDTTTNPGDNVGAEPPTSPTFMKASDLLTKSPKIVASPKVSKKVSYHLKAMKWGLIPFWTKRSPDYSSMLRTINCRDDSLIENRGMWNTMKQRKRCLVIAQGFYEWLKPASVHGGRKVPHFVRRKDGQLMLLAGLWDCVQYEGSDEKLYTYTVITTDSNKQLQFLHDRMPVILDPDTEALKLWLDPTINKWNNELQAILKPYEGELECYPVSQEVGKVGNNSPNFIVPIDSKENKKNIANFFSSPGKTGTKKAESPKVKEEDAEHRETRDHNGTEDNAPIPVPPDSQKGTKRKLSMGDEGDADHGQKVIKLESTSTPQKAHSLETSSFEWEDQGPASESFTPSPNIKSKAGARKPRDPTSNVGLERKISPVKSDGSLRITNFFGKGDSPG